MVLSTAKFAISEDESWDGKVRKEQTNSRKGVFTTNQEPRILLSSGLVVNLVIGLKLNEQENHVRIHFTPHTELERNHGTRTLQVKLCPT